MLIPLTFSHNRNTFYIRADQVRSIERNPDNLLETHVGMMLMTQQGPLTYSVLETPDDIAFLVNNTLSEYLTHR